LGAKQRIGAAALGVTLSLVAAAPAAADFKVWTPDVDYGELSFENIGDLGLDRNRNKSGEQSYTTDVEYGFTNWWQSELELEFERAPGTGQPTNFTQVTSENFFQFTERGEYWLDAGFFAEYGQATVGGRPNETTFGPVLRKDFWGTSTSLNIFVEKNLGNYASGRPVFLYAGETRIDAWEVQLGRHLTVEPGVQIYGTPGPFGHFDRWGRQDERAGPQLFGKIFNIGPGSLEWNGGVLIGLSSSVPALTVRWQAEYEIHY
jgi:acetyltransferase-like isoleucine patch superfamily enzyme